MHISPENEKELQLLVRTVDVEVDCLGCLSLIILCRQCIVSAITQSDVNKPQFKYFVGAVFCDDGVIIVLHFGAIFIEPGK